MTLISWKHYFFGEILWKHLHIFYIYTTHKRLQKWRYHHYLHVEVSWNVTFQFCFFFCSENDADKIIVLIIVYEKAYFNLYFYHRYNSLVCLVICKLWYSYSYWLISTVPTNGKYFLPDNDFMRLVDYTKGYWNPQRKLE